MDSIAPPKPTLDLPAPPAPREAEPARETKAAPLQIQNVEAREAPAPGHLLVRIDAEAGRFVHTMTDPATQETRWRYPSEAQLAYSRAVGAYMRALSGQ
jgi:hypothetical protein